MSQNETIVYHNNTELIKNLIKELIKLIANMLCLKLKLKRAYWQTINCF